MLTCSVERRFGLQKGTAVLPGWSFDCSNSNGRLPQGAQLEGIHIVWGGFEDADLNGVDFSGVHLNGAWLKGAHLNKALLVGTHLQGEWQLFVCALSIIDPREAPNSHYWNRKECLISALLIQEHPCM